MKYPSWALGLVVVGLLGLVLGCGGKKEQDYRAKLSDAGGLSAGHTVVWRGASVGQVTEVGLDQGAIMAVFQLKPEHQGKLYADVSARVSRGFLGQGQPQLELFGGANVNAGLLTPGAIIPEAGYLDGIDQRQIMWGVAALAAGLVLILLLRGFSWVLRLAITVAVLAVAGVFFKMQWDRYKHHLISPETEAVITGKAYEILSHPAAQEAWRGLVEDAGILYQQGARIGEDASNKLTEHISHQLDARIAALTEQGDAGAASDLRALKTFVDELDQ